jgi:predicted NUDIX family NTP pyrophosphohydrolase
MLDRGTALFFYGSEVTEKLSMTEQSAGILLFRVSRTGLEVLLVHPGGPYWQKKNEGVWTIPKGGLMPGEIPLDAAKREFFEETGMQPHGDFISLEPVIQKSGKQVLAWALEGDMEPGLLRSNLFEMEWPPRSGKKQRFPEVDRGTWFPVSQALQMILPAQREFIVQLQSLIKNA